MDNEKFKQLILDVYKKWETLYKIEHIQLFGFQRTYNFSGYIYGKELECSFRDTKEAKDSIEDYVDTMKPDLLVLKSRITGQQVGIDKYHIDNYIIDEDILIIEYKGEKLIFGM